MKRKNAASGSCAKPAAASGAGMKRTESVAFCGLAIALLTVSAWITIPVGPVPFTLQTMILVLILLLFPEKQALTSIFAYVALGACGLPIFSGMKGGLASILGPTGGFIFGWLVGAVLVMAFFRLWRQSKSAAAENVRFAMAAIVFVGASYVCGWAQLVAVADFDPLAAFMAGIAPFALLDVAKVVVAVGLARSLQAAVPALRKAKGNI